MKSVKLQFCSTASIHFPIFTLTFNFICRDLDKVLLEMTTLKKLYLNFHKQTHVTNLFTWAFAHSIHFRAYNLFVLTLWLSTEQWWDIIPRGLYSRRTDWRGPSSLDIISLSQNINTHINKKNTLWGHH